MRAWNEHRGLLKLVGMIVMVPLVAWFFGFRQTVGIWRECRARQATIDRLSASESGSTTRLPGNEVTGKQVLNNGVILQRIEESVENNRGKDREVYSLLDTGRRAVAGVHGGTCVVR